MQQEAVLSLGSNLGDRREYLQQAILKIGEEVGQVTRQSSIHETPSWGFDSHPFLNQVIVVETALEPIALLDTLQEIERLLGRNHKTSYHEGIACYADRTIDIDILFYGNFEINTDRLTIPHPHIQERGFVMLPLEELRKMNNE